MTQFFPGVRRKIELADWVPLLNEQDERRIRFDLVMPLTGQSYAAMPSFVAPAYEQMEKEGSSIKDSDLLTSIEDITLELYATDQSGPLEVEWGIGLDETEAKEKEKKRKLLLTHCTLRNFKLIRIKRGEDQEVALRFSTTTRSTRGLAAWAHDYNGKTMWGEFSLDPSPGQTTFDTQESLPMGGKADTRKRCPFPLCVMDLDHDGDHEDATGKVLRKAVAS